MKCCSKCHHDIPKSDFYKMKSTPDGLRPSCKSCDLAGKDKAKRRVYEKQYWSTRKPDKAAIIKKSTDKNKEHHKVVMSIYRASEQYQQTHRNHSATRRARMNLAFVEHVNYQDVYEEAGGICFYCGEINSFAQSEFDHYIPIAKGGQHRKSNIRCSCIPCNRSKAAKMPEAVRH